MKQACSKQMIRSPKVPFMLGPLLLWRDAITRKAAASDAVEFGGLLEATEAGMFQCDLIIFCEMWLPPKVQVLPLMGV